MSSVPQYTGGGGCVDGSKPFSGDGVVRDEVDHHRVAEGCHWMRYFRATVASCQKFKLELHVESNLPLL